ncbi:hypothetical protein [Flammeovirga sp. EKP202]|uniref:hypothetical protein n=1 Tax=Flammeovirga sp. EKP202 TaxID=2770592 RepID=UPI00165F3A58|nr:hypothetical protein [Flammeovirga sp. EKP202]MBD0405313.1 hypothetical protein [Flammeovirga sp. EKP202]
MKKLFSLLVVLNFISSCNSSIKKDDEKTRLEKNQSNLTIEISEIPIEPELEENIPYKYNGSHNLEMYFSSIYDSILIQNGLNNLKVNRENGFCAGDCCTNINEKSVNNWKLINSITDCGDNGLYVDRWIFNGNELIFSQNISQYYYNENDTVFYLFDEIYDHRKGARQVKRRFTNKEFENGFIDKPYVKFNSKLIDVDSVFKATIEELFNGEDLEI